MASSIRANNKICISKLVIPYHCCENKLTQLSKQSCIFINPLNFDIPPFIKCNYPLKQYNEMLRAVSESPESSQIKDIISRYATLQEKTTRTAPLKPWERSLNESAIRICLYIPQLIFHRRELRNYATQVYNFN